MGLIDIVFGTLFGSGRNVVRETAEVFRVNAEAASQRENEAVNAALQQHAGEFRDARQGFDRFMDGLNRLPRPVMALGCIGLMGASMASPVWFAERMQGLALVPEALWWLIGAVVSFYFGARHQAKGQEFQRDIVQSAARLPQVSKAIDQMESLRKTAPPASVAQGEPSVGDPNPALAAWHARN
ncbi:carboxylesterase [Pseudooceanicola sediminis]|uniref:Carboxylesterase n=1 Tax=Pseudooceanicola sediminis TaxID=2211117 RepID=A0A399J2N5_9RHOB|nr:holin family protein [Pseudooceanicola sediminis]KAA2317340.1 carboxylesterase [Puniceibacterium sp. HSS470]RII39693.1 carboxylesterase [Pseudooceanicola sediminis]|tara:strand:- start:20449 stop:21000 length:552 start_codon:yes stop_codon:yes gene_type:complete